MIALLSLGGLTNWLGIKLIFKRIPGVFFRWVVQLLVKLKLRLLLFNVGSSFSYETGISGS